MEMRDWQDGSRCNGGRDGRCSSRSGSRSRKFGP